MRTSSAPPLITAPATLQGQPDQGNALGRSHKSKAPTPKKASRRLTTRFLAASFTCAVVWAYKVLRGVVNLPRIDGKDGVAGSIPAGGSTTFCRLRYGPAMTPDHAPRRWAAVVGDGGDAAGGAAEAWRSGRPMPSRFAGEDHAVRAGSLERHRLDVHESGVTQPLPYSAGV